MQIRLWRTSSGKDALRFSKRFSRPAFVPRKTSCRCPRDGDRSRSRIELAARPSRPSRAKFLGERTDRTTGTTRALGLTSMENGSSKEHLGVSFGKVVRRRSARNGVVHRTRLRHVSLSAYVSRFCYYRACTWCTFRSVLRSSRSPL